MPGGKKFSGSWNGWARTGNGPMKEYGRFVADRENSCTRG